MPRDPPAIFPDTKSRTNADEMAAKQQDAPLKRKAEGDAQDVDAQDFLEAAQRSVDFLFSPVVVLPGDDVTATLTKTTRRLKLGNHPTASEQRSLRGGIALTLAGNWMSRRRAQAATRPARRVHQRGRAALPTGEPLLGRLQPPAGATSCLLLV
jgi:hypothetical protein